MTDLLHIGASGVRGYQAALTTVSENIAGAGNTSYARRSTALTEVLAINGALSGARANGMGVAIGATTRSADQFRAASVRAAGADLSRTETGAAWLGRIQSSLTGNDLSGGLTGFFTAARALAADPTSTAARASMLESATTVAAQFASTGAALTQVAADLDATADQATASLGSLGTALAKINDALGRVVPGTSAAAGLADQRDAILEDMSAIVDVAATFDTAGRATVRAGGASGPVLVAGRDAGQVTYVRNDEGAVSFAVFRNGEASVMVPGGGVLGGVVDAAQRVQETRAALDTLATEFATGVNQLQADGRDADGNPGAPMFAIGDTPTALSLAITDPAGIAAAGAGEGARGNGNLAALEQLRGSGGFEARLSGTIAGNAAAIEGKTAIATAQGSIHQASLAARDAVSGVDLDQEAVDLLRFQQAYQASSRVIQVARETFQSIIGIN